MTEMNTTWRLGLILAACLTIVAYFFLFPEPLQAELSVRADWTRLLSAETHGDGLPPGAIPFTNGGLYGFFSEDGSVLQLKQGRGARPGTDRMVVRGENGSARLLDTNGDLVAEINSAQPFFLAGRLFSSDDEGMGLSAYDRNGAIEWHYSFPSHVSAFDASEALAVGGTIDGTVEALGTDGLKALSFSPGGSRLPVILGVAVSSDSSNIAMVCGVDPQRLVILSRGGRDYRVASHRYLESDYREPVRVMFMPGQPYVLYRRPEGIGISDIGGSIHKVLPLSAEDFSVHYDPDCGRAYIAARTDDAMTIVAFVPPDRLLGSVSLPADSEFIQVIGSTLYFADLKSLSSLSFLEE